MILNFHRDCGDDCPTACIKGSGHLDPHVWHRGSNRAKARYRLPLSALLDEQLIHHAADMEQQNLSQIIDRGVSLIQAARAIFSLQGLQALVLIIVEGALWYGRIAEIDEHVCALS